MRGSDVEVALLRLALVTLGDPHRRTGGYRYHRMMAAAAADHGAELRFDPSRRSPGRSPRCPRRGRSARRPRVGRDPARQHRGGVRRALDPRDAHTRRRGRASAAGRPRPRAGPSNAQRRSTGRVPFGGRGHRRRRDPDRRPASDRRASERIASCRRVRRPGREPDRRSTSVAAAPRRCSASRTGRRPRGSSSSSRPSRRCRAVRHPVVGGRDGSIAARGTRPTSDLGAGPPRPRGRARLRADRGGRPALPFRGRVRALLVRGRVRDRVGRGARRRPPGRRLARRQPPAPRGPRSGGAHGRAGDVAGLASALRAITTDRNLRDRLAAGARRRAETLPTWASAADRFFASVRGFLRSGVVTADLRAVLFDFDGTLWDSETAVFGVFRDLYEEHGHELTLPTWSAAIGTLGGFDPYAELGRLRGLPSTSTRSARAPRSGSARPRNVCRCARGSPVSSGSSTRRACRGRS